MKPTRDVERMEGLALLRMLAQSRKSVEEGRAMPLADAARLVRARTARKSPR